MNKSTTYELWTDDQKKELIKLWHTAEVIDISRMYKKSPQSIYNMAHRLGLGKKPKKVMTLSDVGFNELEILTFCKPWVTHNEAMHNRRDTY